MNNLFPILLILILVICYCSFKDKDNKKKTKNENNNLVVCLLLVGLVLFFIMNDMSKQQENYSNYYSYLGDNNIPVCKDIKTNQKYKLYDNVKIHSPVGSPHNLTEDLASYSFPTVDGNPNSSRHLFTFAKNQCHIDCCPSTYSCDKGCVCETPEQISRIRTSR